MKNHLYKSLIILGLIIPTFLVSACSEKSEYAHLSSNSKPWLGVKVKNIQERRLSNLNIEFGIEVTKVYRNSPAEKAGLYVEDIILRINDIPINDVDKLIKIILDTENDEKVKITYLREGKELETDVTISKRQKKVYIWNNQHKNLEHFLSDDKNAWLGVSTENLTDQLRQFFKTPEYLGVLINEVVEDSPADKYGLKAGDVIIKVGKKEVEDTNDLIQAIDRYEPGEEVEVIFIRDKKEQRVTIILGKGKGRFRHHFSFRPEKFEVFIPDMKIEIPDIDFEEFEELHEKIMEEIEVNKEELNEELKELQEELKEIKIHTRHRKSITI